MGDSCNRQKWITPLRYSITSDNILCAGSETGMVQIPESKIISKGRLGPGQLIAVNLKKGKIYRDKDIKDYLSKDYKKFHKQIVHLDKKIITEKEFPYFSLILFVYSINEFNM